MQAEKIAADPFHHRGKIERFDRHDDGFAKGGRLGFSMGPKSVQRKIADHDGLRGRFRTAKGGATEADHARQNAPAIGIEG